MKKASLIVLLSALFPLAAFAQVDFIIEYEDAQGYGFYDTTPVSPIGGNTGTTFGEQRRIAFEKAELQAKIAIIRLSGETITSERGMETLDQFTDGIDPDLTKKATFMQKLMTVADKSADAALKLLGTTDEELAAMNQGEKDILLKEDFASRSASIVSSMLSGCTTYKILEGDAGDDDYQVAVCVKYSPELRKLAAIVERDVKYQLDPKKAKNSFSKIKDMPAGADIDKYLPHDLVDFSIMFEKLYPQLMIGSYGITVYWEIQIIHPELRDLEIPVFGRGKDYVYEDFIGLEPDAEAA